MKLEITDVKAKEVLDSRGMPTVKAVVTLEDGSVGCAIVPSGASTGKYEAVELRDDDPERYNGKGVLRAVSNVNNIIAKEIIGIDALNQILVDKKLVEIDGTKNKERLGANSLLAVSLAVARASASALCLPLYKYLGGTNAKALPVPMMNILNGGRHADNNVNIQEFMIMPVGAKSFSQALRWCSEVYHSLKRVLKEKGYSTAVGDEGGFAPNLSCDEEALELIVKAIENAGFKKEKDFMLALDVAASEMYIDEGKYHFFKTGEVRSTNEMIDLYEDFIDKYPIISIEDGLGEEDWEGWSKLKRRIGDKVQLVGDDLFVTNTERIKKGINEESATSVLIKLNQIGTLSEAMSAIELAKINNMTAVVSHRSGETEDTFIADLAVACNCMQIKSGACARTERVAKYNRLLDIEEEIGESSVYSGMEAFYSIKKERDTLSIREKREKHEIHDKIKEEKIKE